ncbi:MAG: hypothetical protein JJE30_00250 [Desulfuromonadales bacterium]|nr:hypothetical protein [Desulfuromonadales bacterium]
MSVHVLLDSTSNLDIQNQILNIYQKNMRCRVVDFVSTDTSQNDATFEMKPLSADVPVLHLIAIPSGSSSAKVQPPNTTLTFEHTVLVNLIETAVAGFHGS